MEALHFYCVAGPGARADAKLTDLAAPPVSLIREADLLALVAPAPARPYKEMPREALLALLAGHQAVIERAMARLTVAPVKFGTTLRNAQEARRILQAAHDHFASALAAVDGKVELDVVGQWRSLEAVLRQIAGEPEIGFRRAAIAQRPAAETLEPRIRLGMLLKTRLEALRDVRSAEILQALAPFVQDSCPHALAGDRMLFNAAFLVDQRQEAPFTRALEALDRRYADAIDFRCVGPLPAYSFCTLQIKTFEVEGIERARQVLGIGEDAGAAEVRSAYRRQAQQAHPDRAVLDPPTTSRDPGPRFRSLTEAYRHLEEYLEVGHSLRASDVRAAVAVRRYQWSQDGSGA